MVASLLSAPAGLVVAKLMVPETERPETRAGADLRDRGTAHEGDPQGGGAQDDPQGDGRGRHLRQLSYNFV